MAHRISNGILDLVVIPEQGGRIDSLVDRRTRKEWLWHPPGYALEAQSKPRGIPVGAPFDAHWAGGWEEMFPSDTACLFQERRLPDHGELWSQPWQVVESTGFGIKMSYSCRSVPVRVEKMIFLDPGSPSFKLRYLFKNDQDERQPFHLKLHPALAIEEGDRILMPSCMIEPVVLEFSTILGRAGKTRFPHGVARDGSEVRIDQVPSREAGTREFVYATDLSEGRCGLWSERTKSALTVSFDSRQVPYVWIFQSHGGWNGHQVLMLEPCTNIPYELEVAHRQGTCAILEPREAREYEFSVRIDSGEPARAY